MSDANKIILWLAFILFLVIAGPFLTIWAVNTLFPALAIPFTFDTWCAVVILGVFIRRDGVKVSK